MANLNVRIKDKQGNILSPTTKASLVVNNNSEDDITYSYFNYAESEAERKKPEERTLLDELLAYGAEYREQACIEEVASRDPSY